MGRPLVRWAVALWGSTAGLVLLLLLVHGALNDCSGADADTSSAQGSGPAEAPPRGSAFRCWADGVLASGQPAWKRRVLQGSPGEPITFRATWYAASEGEVVGAWCKGGRAIALRWGHVATDWDHWPPGSVFWAPSLGCLLVSVDKGGLVNGPRRVDVYMPNRAALAAKGHQCSGPIVLCPLGKVSWEEAR